MSASASTSEYHIANIALQISRCKCHTANAIFHPCRSDTTCLAGGSLSRMLQALPNTSGCAARSAQCIGEEAIAASIPGSERDRDSLSSLSPPH